MINYDNILRKLRGYKLKEIYWGQCSRDKNRGFEIGYSYKEFKATYIDDTTYIELFKQWATSDFNTDLAPSFDRLDNTKGYSFNNIQIVTWEENNSYGRIYRKTAKIQCRAISQYDLAGSLLQKYESASEASRATGFNRANIGNTANASIVGKTINRTIFIYDDTYTDELLLERIVQGKKALERHIGAPVVKLHKDTEKVLAHYKNATEAAKELPNTNKVSVVQSILGVCKGKKLTSNGFKWKYKKET